MVKLPTNTKLSIRQRSVEMVQHHEAVVSFEMFAYPANNGGQSSPVVVLSKSVPYVAKNPASMLSPNYDQMVTQAASELAKDFIVMTNILNAIADPEGQGGSATQT